VPAVEAEKLLESGLQRLREVASVDRTAFQFYVQKLERTLHQFGSQPQ
jgi:hypothetical protein